MLPGWLDILEKQNMISFLVYCRELAPGTVSLTGDRAQGDDSKHDSHSFFIACLLFVCLFV